MYSAFMSYYVMPRDIFMTPSGLGLRSCFDFIIRPEHPSD